MAPHILDIEWPEANPSGAPGGDFEHIPSSPEMFGGLSARGLGALGEGLTRAADTALSTATDINRLQDQIHASELHSDFSNKASDLFAEFMQKQGRAAVDARPIFTQKLADLQKQAQGSSGNLYTQALVGQNTRILMDKLNGWAAEHANHERTAWGKNTAQSNAESATNMGALAINSLTAPDFKTLDGQLRSVDAEWRNFYDPDGLDQGTMDAQIAKRKGETVKNWVETAATNLKDPDAIPHALQIFERFTPQIDSGTRLVIDKYLNTAAHNLVADRLATHFIATPGRTEDTTLSPEMRAWLDTIHGSETPQGGYDTLYGGKSVQQVKPGYDYADHPAIFFPGPFGQTSAAGRYQIVSSTWNNYKDRYGLTDFTPVSQDQFAAQRSREVYAQAVRNGRFKQFAVTGNLDNDLAANGNNPAFLLALGHAASGEWTSLLGGKEPNANTGSFAQRFAKNIAIEKGESSPIPDAQDVVDRINADPALASRPDIREQVVKRAIAKISMQQHAFNLARKANEDQSNAAELQIFANIHSDKPTVTLDQIMAAPMTREAKERMVTQLEHVTGKEDKADKTYGTAFYDLYRRIHLPDNDPNRLTDPGELYGHVGPRGDLTVAGVDKLFTEIQGRKTPEGVAESEMKSQFLKNARAQITGTDEGLHMRDPKGDELYLKFIAQVLPRYQEARNAGKTPSQLLDPDSPDYVGKGMIDKPGQGFRRPMNQWYSDMLQDQPQPQQGSFDLKSVKTLDDARAAYKAGNITRDQARQLALDHPEWGVVVREPKQQMPEVPIIR